MGFVPIDALDADQRNSYFDLRDMQTSAQSRNVSSDPVAAVLTRTFINSFRSLALR